MRVISFDLFDTLITRLLALPYDIWVQVGLDLNRAGIFAGSANEFAQARSNAETEVRKASPTGEVSFAAIYKRVGERLNWPPESIERAMEVELAVERKYIKAVPDAGERLRQARVECDAILFISDMYLPKEFLNEILHSSGLILPTDRLYVSHEHDRCKASGHLYQHIREELKEVKWWRHHGDNLHSDVKMAGPHGIEAVHEPRCLLNRYEQAARNNSSPEDILWRSKLAGAMRWTRIGENAGNTKIELWNVAADVAGPLLFAFMGWVLQQARKKKLKRLYFISRDGQILKDVAGILCKNWGLDLELRYLYGSRQAWIPATLDELDDYAKTWVLSPEQRMSVHTCLGRLGLGTEEARDTLQNHGFPEPEWNQNLSPDRREELWKLILTSDIKSKAAERNKHQRELALRYFEQEGLFEDDIPWGMVDIGWRGNMQRSLRKLLGHRKNPPNFPGYYLGLLRVPGMTYSNEFMDWWCLFEESIELFERNTAFFELFTFADHGTVLRYREAGGKVEPVLDQVQHLVTVEYGVLLMQRAVKNFASTASSILGPEEAPSSKLFGVVKSLYDLFYFNPTAREALEWGNFPFPSQGIEDYDEGPTFFTSRREWDIIRALLDYRKRPPMWWMPGQKALNFSPSLALFLKAKQFRKNLRRRR